MAQVGKFERNLAYRVFKVQKTHGQVPIPVRESARKIIEGSASEHDINNVRGYLGVFKSGAGAINKGISSFEKGIRPYQDLMANVQLAQLAAKNGDGAQGLAAQARIVSIVNQQLQKGLKSKFAKEATEGLLSQLGKDPGKAGALLNAIGRGLRLGGAVAQVAQAGFNFAIGLNKQSEKANKSLSNALSTARSLDIDPNRRRREAELAQADVLKTQTTPGKILDSVYRALGFSTHADELSANKQTERLKLIARTRNSLGELGIDANAALAMGARLRGKTVDQLTNIERNAILDQAAYGSTNLNAQKRRAKEQVNMKLEKEFSGWKNWTFHAKHYGLSVLQGASGIGALLHWLGYSYADETAQAEIEARKQQLEKEAAEGVITALEQKKLDRIHAQETRRAGFAPAQNFKIREQSLIMDAAFNSTRSRHVGWSNR